ncbi:MAG: hypothetical protein JWR54_3213, partial [Mucilaginibacter sp.]|nr:hypothetical protein [Mucilaginibacter sp.]
MALEKQFSEIITLIKQSRLAAFKTINVELIN